MFENTYRYVHVLGPRPGKLWQTVREEFGAAIALAGFLYLPMNLIRPGFTPRMLRSVEGAQHIRTHKMSERYMIFSAGHGELTIICLVIESVP